MEIRTEWEEDSVWVWERNEQCRGMQKYWRICDAITWCDSKLANDFIVEIWCNAELFGVKFTPGRVAVDNGTDTTKLTAAVVGVDDGVGADESEIKIAD